MQPREDPKPMIDLCKFAPKRDVVHCAEERSGKKPRQRAEDPVTVPNLSTAGTSEGTPRQFARSRYNPEPLQYCKYSAVWNKLQPALESSTYVQDGVIPLHDSL